MISFTRKACRLAAVVLLLQLLPAAPGGSTEPPSWPVADIDISGLVVLPKSEVRNLLSIETIPWKPWAKRHEYTRRDVEENAERIRRFLQREGFYHGSVDFVIEQPEEKGAVRVLFRIVEGPPTLVEEIRIEGLLEAAEELRDQLKAPPALKLGDRFRLELFEQSKKNMTDLLRNQGYPWAEVRGKVKILRGERSAEIDFIIDPGKRVVFGKIGIRGVDARDEAVVRAKLRYKEGDLYSRSKLQESQRAVFNLGPFASVVMEPGVDRESAEDRLPIEVDTTYRKLRSVKVGVGCGSEDKFRIQAAWLHRNFFGEARRLEFSGKFSFLVNSLEGRLFQPVFLSPEQSAEEVLGLRRDVQPSYTNRKIFNRISVSRNIGPLYQVSPAHQLEVNFPETVDLTDPKELSAEGERFIISTLELGVQRDSRDDLLNPTRGSLVHGSLGYASQAFGSEVDFLVMTAGVRTYMPLIEDVVIAARLLAGTMTPTENTDDIPVFKRFFSGGADSVRGYPYQDLGPKDSNDNPLGGRSLIEGSLEVRFPIWKELGGVAFLDFGNVYASSFSWSPGKLRYSSGAGLRYATPVGPIRFDFGYQLNPEDEGGRYQFHFSIGQAF